jgi:hypothetical protein
VTVRWVERMRGQDIVLVLGSRRIKLMRAPIPYDDGQGG